MLPTSSTPPPQLAQSGLDLPRLLRNLRLLHDLDGEETLSVAAVLVFGEAPQRWLPHSRLSAVLGHARQHQVGRPCRAQPGDLHP